MIELITIFRPWLDGGQPSQPASQLAAPTQSQPMPVSVQSTAPRPMQPIMTVSAKAEADKAIRAMSIVNQIDTVLQARLADTPLEKSGHSFAGIRRRWCGSDRGSGKICH
ncbi:MAG: hypothetical protein IPO36_18705 [Anaerolineales bacterium]|nr:hypothetical protein [Anaerolineales bacterium]